MLDSIAHLVNQVQLLGYSPALKVTSVLKELSFHNPAQQAHTSHQLVLRAV
jgi:hypothetical protein